MKRLSIIIPTYNMESLLPRCLESLIAAKYAETLDVLVVNDGSKDNSSYIAHQYEDKFPNLIKVIDKSNGNYGSTINAGLLEAKGKYVKVLDSDDRFDTEALDKLLELLLDVNSDIAVTHFSQIGPNKAKEVIRYNTMGYEPYTYGKVYDLDDVLADGYIRFFLMHSLTYKTDLLKEIKYKQTEGISYTDTEWATIPIFHAKTICFFNLNVYQYNLDREGQTMDPNVLLKSIPQMEKVNDQLIQYYMANRDKLSQIRAAFMKQFYENRVRILYKTYLLDMPRDKFCTEDFLLFDERLSKVCQLLGLHPKLYPENKILRIEYISYWHKYHKRWPVWLEKINHWLDIVIKWVYIKFFRS
jgi:glycosyltransferase involved in cell wall biosynthesis